MRVRRLVDPAEFLAAAGSLLLEDEARHNLMLGIAGTLRDRPDHYPEFHLWVVESRESVVGAALQTPPFNVAVARPASDGVLEALADAIAREGIALPGVTAAVPEVDLFAHAWERRTGVTRRRRMAMRIYAVSAVRPVAGVPGRARAATTDDRDLLIGWLQAFLDEALVGAPVEDAESSVDARLRTPTAGFMLWEDPAPVSMAAWGGLTPNGIRIGAVYTPPSLRRRGYASAITAAVSSEQLTAGRKLCLLYTDLANPTSNKIYMQIGYEPVCDSVEYAFDRS